MVTNQAEMDEAVSCLGIIGAFIWMKSDGNFAVLALDVGRGSIEGNVEEQVQIVRHVPGKVL